MNNESEFINPDAYDIGSREDMIRQLNEELAETIARLNDPLLSDEDRQEAQVHVDQIQEQLRLLDSDVPGKESSQN
jgi:hypothetical protein